MVISKREKYIAIGAGSAVVLLILDSFLFTPFLQRKEQLESNQQIVAQKLTDAANVMSRQRAMKKVWLQIQQGGLKSDISSAESQAQRATLAWAQNAGIAVDSFKREQPGMQEKFQVVSFGMQGHGSTPSIAKLLWSIETATIPIRINDLRIQARKEGTDDLSVVLSISTLATTPESGKTAAVAMNNPGLEMP